MLLVAEGHSYDVRPVPIARKSGVAHTWPQVLGQIHAVSRGGRVGLAEEYGGVVAVRGDGSVRILARGATTAELDQMSRRGSALEQVGRLAILAVSTAALLGTPAHASTAFHAAFPAGGPALAAGIVNWAEPRRDGGVNIRRRDPHRDKTQLVLANPGGGYQQYARFAGSNATLAAEIFSSDIPRDPAEGGLNWAAQDLFDGAPTGPLTRLGTHCDLGGSPQLARTLDASGPRLIYLDCDRNRVVVTNTSTHQSADTPAGSSGLRIAGRYIAWIGCCSGAGPVSVYDWRAGKLVYTIAAPEAGGPWGDLDLGPDGTLVVAKPPEKEHQIGARLAWAAPTSPHLHILPLARSTYFVTLVGGKIAFERGTEDSGDVPRGEVGLTDLAGHLRIVARGAYAAAFERQFDFDGKRIAWYAYSCSGVRMHVQSIDSSQVITESLLRCPLVLKRKPQVTKDGVVSLRFSCYGYSGGHFGYPPACSARDVVLTAKDAGHSVVVARGRKASHVPLTSAGKTLLKKRGSLSVRITATMGDPAGTRECRHGRATISSPSSG